MCKKSSKRVLLGAVRQIRTALSEETARPVSSSFCLTMPRSCRRSSTLRSESGNRTYNITAKRMISGLVLKYLNGECFVIRQAYETTLLASTEFNLTVPSSCILAWSVIFIKSILREVSSRIREIFCHVTQCIKYRIATIAERNSDR
jgi:hypothetical protein